MFITKAPHVVVTSFGFVLALSALSGCATPTSPQPNNVDEIERRLAEAADTVADSMAKLAIVEQSARGIHAQAITPAQLPPDLRLKVDLEYQGDIQPLVERLAATVGYRVEMYGRRNSTSPVNIHARAREIGLILADADYQTSYRCDVFVIPDRRLIELRFNRS